MIYLLIKILCRIDADLTRLTIPSCSKQQLKGVGKGAAVAAQYFEKKNKISKYLNVLINGTASAIASDHLWSIVRQSVHGS